MATPVLWISPTDFVSGDDSIKINYPSAAQAAVDVKASPPGDQKWIYLGLRIPSDYDISAITISYQLSNSRTFISQIQLLEMQTPDQRMVRHDDDTDLLNTTPTSYRSAVLRPFRPTGAVLLALRLKFGNVADTISLGAVGVEAAASSRGEVNVLDFGADPTGVADSAEAFMAAIASFGPPNDSSAGTVTVPLGKYRFATPVRIKKAVLIKGSQSGSTRLSTTIVPDAGIEAFVFEYLNTPMGTTSAGTGLGAQIQNLVVKPASTAANWQNSHNYVVGDKVRTGTGAAEDWRRHYICTTGGTSASSGSGPRSLGNDDESDGTVRWRYLGTGAGIMIRTPSCTLRDVGVIGASGCGVHIQGSPPSPLAHYWHLDNVNIWKCDGHGLFVTGEANGGSFIHGNLVGNGSPTSDEDFTGQGYNIYESSEVGNTYVSVAMGSGGQGSIYSDCIGGGSSFIGCYVEGSGGGESLVTGTCVIVGGGLAAGLFDPHSAPVTLGPLLSSQGQGHRVAGYTGARWKPNTPAKVGNRRQNGGRLYEVISAGNTASAGGPTGTGAEIVDGTAKWKYVHDVTDPGDVTLGSREPRLKTFFTATAPDDKNVGQPTYYRYGDFPGGYNDVQGFQYGVSSRAGLMHAVNKTKLAEWPMHIPPGHALFEKLWIGGRSITADKEIGAPQRGTWNPGDRIYFKGKAVVPGGAEGLECVTDGTAGIYSGGRTATADGSTKVRISGAPMDGLIDYQDFKVGDKLTINNVTGRVRDVSEDGLIVTMTSFVPAGTGLPITFAPPTFKEFGRIAGGAGDSTAVPGNATVNTQKGRSAIAAGASSVTITNNKVVPSSIIHATLQTTDLTLTQILSLIPGTGNFIITGNARATAAVNFCWSIDE